MTIAAPDMLDCMRPTWPDVVLLEPPRPLRGGYWASMHHLRIGGQPAGVPSDVVLRVAPHRAMGAKETAVQRTVADGGFPTPPVRLAGDDPDRGWWSVMDHAAGAPLVGDLGAGDLLRAPARLGRVPAQLATTMAALHRLDPAQVSDAVATEAPDVAWSVAEVLARFRSGATDLGRVDLVAAVDALVADAPPTTRPVVCHGDLHPFNVLADGDRLTLIDWTGAIVADAAYDVAFTALMLANPPVPVPRVLRPAVGAAESLLARRFLASYRAATTAPSLASLDGLGWCRGLHATRVLLEVAQLDATDANRPHPFRAIVPATTRIVGRATGVTVRA